jgi:hypothetical protein
LLAKFLQGSESTSKSIKNPHVSSLDKTGCRVYNNMSAKTPANQNADTPLKIRTTNESADTMNFTSHFILLSFALWF